jgi:hypothetical protein
VFDAVDVVEQDEVWFRILERAEDAALVVADGLPELFGRPELVERVGVEREVTEPAGIVATLEAVCDELVEERGLADAAASDQSEEGLVLELAVGGVGTGEVVEVAMPDSQSTAD